MFISVILSDAQRSVATKRESKNPENFSFIHTASGSSHNTPSAVGSHFKAFSGTMAGFNLRAFVSLFVRHHTPSQKLVANSLHIVKERPCSPPGRLSPDTFGGRFGPYGNPKVYFLVNHPSSPTPPLVSHPIPVWRRFIPLFSGDTIPIGESSNQSIKIYHFTNIHAAY